MYLIDYIAYGLQLWYKIKNVKEICRKLISLHPGLATSLHKASAPEMGSTIKWVWSMLQRWSLRIIWGVGAAGPGLGTSPDPAWDRAQDSPHWDHGHDRGLGSTTKYMKIQFEWRWESISRKVPWTRLKSYHDIVFQLKLCGYICAAGRKRTWPAQLYLYAIKIWL